MALLEAPTERVVLGLRDQARPDRILQYPKREAFEVAIDRLDPVAYACLPKRPAIRSPSPLERTERLPAPHKVLDRAARPRRHQQMNVIRHHAVGNHRMTHDMPERAKVTEAVATEVEVGKNRSTASNPKSNREDIANLGLNRYRRMSQRACVLHTPRDANRSRRLRC